MKQERKAEMACTHHTPPFYLDSNHYQQRQTAPRGIGIEGLLHQAAAATGCSTGHRHRRAATLGGHWQRRSAPLGTSAEGLLRPGTGRDGMLCGVLSATVC